MQALRGERDSFRQERVYSLDQALERGEVLSVLFWAITKCVKIECQEITKDFPEVEKYRSLEFLKQKLKVIGLAAKVTEAVFRLH